MLHIIFEKNKKKLYKYCLVIIDFRVQINNRCYKKLALIQSTQHTLRSCYICSVTTNCGENFTFRYKIERFRRDLHTPQHTESFKRNDICQYILVFITIDLIFTKVAKNYIEHTHPKQCAPWLQHSPLHAQCSPFFLQFFFSSGSGSGWLV